MLDNLVAAIDIGTTKIVAIVGKRNTEGKIEVLAMGESPSLGVIRGEVQNIYQASESIATAVSKAKSFLAQQNIDYEFKDVYVGIAGRHIRCCPHRGNLRCANESILKQEDIDALIESEYDAISKNDGESIVAVFPQSYIVNQDIETNDPVGMYYRELEANFHLAIGNSNAVSYINQAIELCNLKVIKVFLEPLASADAVLDNDEKEVGVALVDIGGGTTDIAVYYKNTVRHVAVIPFGGEVITRDILNCCGIVERYAERLKLDFGQVLCDSNEDRIISIPGIMGRPPVEISIHHLSGIIQARVEEIIDAVNFELDAAGVKECLAAGIVLTGGGAGIKNLPQLINFQTSFSARIGAPIQHIACVDGIDNINNPKFATAVGLLINGFANEDKIDSKDKNSAVNEVKSNPESIDFIIDEPAKSIESDINDETINTKEENNSETEDSSNFDEEEKSNKKGKSFINKFTKALGDFFEIDATNDSRM